MKRTYKFRLYPTASQQATFIQWLTSCRLLYNTALAERKEAWETQKRSVTYGEQASQLKDAKKANPLLQTVGFVLNYHKKKLRLSKIGCITIKLHRPIPAEGEIKTCTITRDVDHWYACFSVALPNPNPESQRDIQRAVGVDVGLKSFLTLNNGDTIDNPRWLRHSEQKLAKEQRRKDRKVKDSHNRHKQNMKVAQVHRKIRNQRKDFHHKLSRKLVDSYDLIVYEQLTITNMVKNHHLAKSISDAGWGQLMRFTEYKAEEAGTLVEYVSAYHTTQLCSRCGKLVPKTLATRIHSCPYCGLMLARDHNSAITVLHRSTYYLERRLSSGQELPVEPG